MERTKSSIERAEELRKELLKLKDEEVSQIEKGEGDSDLIALRSEWIGGLGAEELESLHKLLMLRRGVERGYRFEKDEIEGVRSEIKKLDSIVARRKSNILSEELRKRPGEVLTRGDKRTLPDKEMQEFERRFGNEDYVALYHRWIKRQFENFFREHSEYRYEEVTVGKS